MIKYLKEYYKLLLTFLTLPIIVLVLAYIIEFKQNSELREALMEVYPGELISVSMSEFCKDYKSIIPSHCADNSSLKLIKIVSTITAIIGIGFLFSIKIAGRVSKRNRRSLLLIFKPGFYLTIVILILLIILQTALSMYVLVSLFWQVTFLVEIAIKIIMISALFGVYILIKAFFSMFKKVKITVLGKTLDRKQHPKLWEFITILSKQIGTTAPEYIVAGLEPNFYVTEVPVYCLDGILKGRTLYISIPLCRIMTAREMRAVLTHELAHYKGLDAQFSRKFYPIYRGAEQALRRLSEKEGEIFLYPIFIGLSYFLNTFSTTESKIRRERELIADNEAKEIGDSRNLASALIKFNAFSPTWFIVKECMRSAIKEEKKLINASTLFVEIANANKKEIFDTILEEGPSHPMDSHPPLQDRLKNLNLSLEDVRKESRTIFPRDPAFKLFDNMEIMEEELTALEIHITKINHSSPLHVFPQGESYV